ncbi:hypothetical protein [Flavobacterium sp.]|uniref:hypothetical protein n=1 Tax=Flavobacterium sp. TaxID=239 RepID=UPI0037535F38
MEIESVKNSILEIHEVWDVLGDCLDCFKYGEIHESYVVEIISDYCVNKGYEVEGFPIQKRESALMISNFDEDYFCHNRYIKYLDILATKYDDVFELMYFYSSTFWPDHFYDEKIYKERLLDYISCDVYEIAF